MSSSKLIDEAKIVSCFVAARDAHSLTKGFQSRSFTLERFVVFVVPSDAEVRLLQGCCRYVVMLRSQSASTARVEVAAHSIDIVRKP